MDFKNINSQFFFAKITIYLKYNGFHLKNSLFSEEIINIY